MTYCCAFLEIAFVGETHYKMSYPDVYVPAAIKFGTCAFLYKQERILAPLENLYVCTPVCMSQTHI